MRRDIAADSHLAPLATRDDQILPVTRWLARLIVPVLFLGFILLYIWPDRTEELFAWTIRPRMTPLLMGAGYLGGAYFFYGRRWPRNGITSPLVSCPSRPSPPS